MNTSLKNLGIIVPTVQKNKLTLDLCDDSVKIIIISALQEDYKNLKQDLVARRNGKIKHGVFHADLQQDILKIENHISSIKDVLSFYMTDEDFKTWLKSKGEVS